MQLRDHEAVKTKADVFRADPRLLRVEDGFNVRNLDAPEERPDLEELKGQIRGVGVRVPLEIRISGDDLYIVSGHRRHRAVMELIAEGDDITTVPCVAEPKITNDAERTIGLITLNAGKPLSVDQKAEVIRRLIGYGWERSKIASRVGVTAQTIAGWEDLLAAPESLRSSVRSGEMSATEAVKLHRKEGDNASQALDKARDAAKAAGKSRITRQSIERTKAPRATVSVREGAQDFPPDDGEPVRDISANYDPETGEIFEQAPQPAEAVDAVERSDVEHRSDHSSPADAEVGVSDSAGSVAANVSAGVTVGRDQRGTATPIDYSDDPDITAHYDELMLAFDTCPSREAREWALDALNRRAAAEAAEREAA